MSSKLARDAFESEMSAVDGLISSLDEDDILGRASLSARRQVLSEEVSRLAGALHATGSVILSFDGGPVFGSRGIDAGFAATTLQHYQNLIAKQAAAAEVGGLAQRGPVPSRASAKLQITNVVHGSFGFQLEEVGDDQFSFEDSGLKKTIREVDAILKAFSDASQNLFEDTLARVDRRVFISAQEFYESLYRDSASLKIIESDDIILISRHAVLRARERIIGVSVTDEEYRSRGRLLGLAPIQRRFDFMTGGSFIISGQVGQRLSNDYLERINGDERLAGLTFEAVIQRRVATRADGSTSESFTLVDLKETDATDDDNE